MGAQTNIVDLYYSSQVVNPWQSNIKYQSEIIVKSPFSTIHLLARL